MEKKGEGENGFRYWPLHFQWRTRLRMTLGPKTHSPASWASAALQYRRRTAVRLNEIS